MSNVDPSTRASTLGVQDVEDMLEELSKQISLPDGGLLRGEVLRTFGGGAGVHLRDGGRATVEVRMEQPIHAERGDFVEIRGVPKLVAEAVPVGLRVVWRGGAARNRGPSQRFRERRALVETRAAGLPFATPRINASLRSGGRVRVVTEPASKAWQDVELAARQYRWLKPDPRYSEDMREPAAIAAALTALLPVVNAGDVVLVACEGAEFAVLDVFEDERVVGALASLTERCATILAVGHAGDELMTNKVVTYPIETAAAAVQLIVRESRERSGDAQATEDVEEGPSAPTAPAASEPRSPPSRLSAVLVRLLLLGAAAYLGWWARGLFPTGEAAQRHAAAPSALSSAVP